MLDLALKKNEKLEFELAVAQKRVVAVEEALKEVEFLRARNTELESEIRLYKTKIKSVESRSAVYPESVAVDELRRVKITQEVEIEDLKKELNILRSNYKVRVNQQQCCLYGYLVSFYETNVLILAFFCCSTCSCYVL